MNSLKFILSLILTTVAIIVHCQYFENDPNLIETESGLKYKITKQGTGEYPMNGDKIWVHYYTKLTNDSIISTSINKGPLDVFLGQGQLIKGWEEGLKLLQPGGSILLVIPPHLAYGNTEQYGIPANSTLICEVNLLQVNKGTPITPFNTNNIEAKTTSTGIVYYEVKSGVGKKAIDDDNAYIHYSGFLPDNTLFDSSIKKGKPVRITVGIKQLFEGLDTALKLMNKGSKFRFIIPSELAYGSSGLGQIVPPNTKITIDIELVDLKTPPTIEQWNIHKKEITTTDSGLKYAVLNKGEGDLIQDEDIVEIHYSGFFTNGTLFDSSRKRFEPFRFPVGINAVIEGWDEGLKHMRKGAKFQFHIPANLAYGEEGAPPQIPANTDLIFDIEVVDVLNK